MSSMLVRFGCLIGIVASLVACGKEDSNAGTAKPSGSTTPAASTQAAMAKASAKPAASAAPGADPITTPPSDAAKNKAKIVVNECIFEFEAPDTFTENKDNAGELQGKTFKFMGFSGSAIYGESLDKQIVHADDPPDIYRGVANGVNMTIHRSRFSDPSKAVGCHGEEAEIKGRSVGCAFLAWGPRDHDGDLVDMCKSVRITYDASKVK